MTGVQTCALPIYRCRTYQSLEEQFHYLQQVGSFYFRESGNDLFDFYTSLFYKLGQDNEDSKAVYDRIHRMLSKAGDLSFIDQELFASRSQTFQSSLNLMESNDSAEAGSSGDSEILGKLAGSLNTILDYAGSDLDTVTSFRQHVHAYKLLSDRASQDQDVALLRRQLTEEFYLLYSLLFLQALVSTAEVQTSLTQHTNGQIRLLYQDPVIVRSQDPA